MPNEQEPSGEITSHHRSADGGPTEEKPKLQYGPDLLSIDYGQPKPCTECGGTGSIALLVTARACKACEGTGKIWPEPRRTHTPGVLGYVRCKRQFDEQGRLILLEQRFEPVANAGEVAKLEQRKDVNAWGGKDVKT